MKIELRLLNDDNYPMRSRAVDIKHADPEKSFDSMLYYLDSCMLR
jgi:hypothetical protein